MIILETKDLRKHYGSGETEVRALDGVDLTVEKGEFAAVVGTSGSGKSTLLHMLGGLDRPTSGSVTVDGKNIFSLKDEALTIFRRRGKNPDSSSTNYTPCPNLHHRPPIRRSSNQSSRFTTRRPEAQTPPTWTTNHRRSLSLRSTKIHPTTPVDFSPKPLRRQRAGVAMRPGPGGQARIILRRAHRQPLDLQKPART